MKASFLIRDVPTLLVGEAVYRPREYSLDFVPNRQSDLDQRKGNLGAYEILLGETLTLSVGIEAGVALYVSGYHPSGAWKHHKLSPPQFVQGSLEIRLAEYQPISGTGIQVSEAMRTWTTKYDHTNQWLCIGDPQMADEGSLVEFASNTVAALQSDRLVAIWIRPIFQSA